MNLDAQIADPCSYPLPTIDPAVDSPADSRLQTPDSRHRTPDSRLLNIPRHPKLRGEWAETHFLARASEHGLHVSKPYGDCLPYDFIVEHGGRMMRVQVKSTSFQCPGYTGYKCFVKPTKGKRYRPDALDFIAAYILPEDIWYIIPFRELTNIGTVHLDPASDRNRYHRYREAWELMSGEWAGSTQ